MTSSVWDLPQRFLLKVQGSPGSPALDLTLDQDAFPPGRLPVWTSHSKSTLKGTPGSKELHILAFFNQLSGFGL